MTFDADILKMVLSEKLAIQPTATWRHHAGSRFTVLISCNSGI